MRIAIVSFTVLGNELRRRLVARGHEVTVLNRVACAEDEGDLIISLEPASPSAPGIVAPLLARGFTLYVQLENADGPEDAIGLPASAGVPVLRLRCPALLGYGVLDDAVRSIADALRMNVPLPAPSADDAPFVYLLLDDLADALERIIEAPARAAEAGTLSLAVDPAPSFADMVCFVADELGRPPPRLTHEARRSSAAGRELVAFWRPAPDTGPAQRLLGWRPTPWRVAARRIVSELGPADLPPLEAHNHRARRPLGLGKMGAVYEVVDVETGQTMAAKACFDGSPEAVYYLKREFRTLADLDHPHLPHAFELHRAGGRWFFTLELLEGISLSTLIKDRSAGGPRGDDAGHAWAPAWRRALADTARAVHHLHRRGILHRDVKPDNVFVTRAGRAVLLDFGLATSPARPSAYGVPEDNYVGTPPYMAPEQIREVPLEPSADWYGFGSLLFECLTGVTPFAGHPVKILLKKNFFAAPDPAASDPRLPVDLSTLCRDLLARDPAQRPSGELVLRALGEADDEGEPGGGPCSPPPAAASIETLAQVLRDLAGRPPGLVVIAGATGAGAALVARAALAQRAGRGDALGLAVRCHAGDRTPFALLDAVVDALSDALTLLPDTELEPMRADAALVAGFFPTLWRVRGLGKGARGAAIYENDADANLASVPALQRLLVMLGQRRHTVLLVEAAEHADLASIGALTALSFPAGSPGLTVVAIASSGLPQALAREAWACAGFPAGLQVEIAADASAPAERENEAPPGRRPSAPTVPIRPRQELLP
jgi:hypothetical protein